jgi:hemolysin activation/secretion protein
MLKLLTIVAVMSIPTLAAAQAPPSAPPETTTPTEIRSDRSEADQAAQEPTRQAAIEQEQSAKFKAQRPYAPNRGEQIFHHIDTILQGGRLRWHPFFENAYSGGGFTLGVGHINYVSAYNYIDARGSYTISNYKRVEAEFFAPRMFNRRGQLSLLGGWREATQVGFFGIGMDNSKDDRTNYLFRQPYGSASFTIFPIRRGLMLGGGFEVSRWTQLPGEGAFPSVETRYTPEELPGLGAEVTYLHSQATIGIDWRTSPGYSRRGGYYGATFHDYSHPDDDFGFKLLEYEAIQHVPILRETWVLSFRGRVQTATSKDDQQTPFFMLPALGGGSSLRGYSSWRFRDRNSLLLQAEWRVMVNRYFDLAFFYDTGKVAARAADLDFDNLRDDFGIGARFHGPFATPLRVELAKSREGLHLVFSSSAVF